MDKSNAIETRVCKKCQQDLPISEFYFRKEKNNYRSCCKKCKSVNTKEEIKERMGSPTKICKHCGLEKPTIEYQKAGGGKWLQPYCKPCDAVRKKKHLEQNIDNVVIRRKNYYQSNKSIILEKQKEYLKKNREDVAKRRAVSRERDREKINKRHREYGKKNKDKIYAKQKQKREANPEYYKKKVKEYKESWSPERWEKHRAAQKEYRIKNKDRIKQYRDSPEVRYRRRIYNREHGRKKNATDISFKIVKNLRSRIGFALKRNIKKSDTTKKLLGCTVDFFKDYFQSKFTEGMTWQHFMNGDIHIDHIKPCKEFDLTKTEEQQKCFHYTNLQPLWWHDNLKKGATYKEKKVS